MISIFNIENDILEVYSPETDEIRRARYDELDRIISKDDFAIIYDSFNFYLKSGLSNNVIDIKFIINSLCEHDDLSELYDQYYDGGCSSNAIILYKLYDVYLSNGAYDFIKSKHDLYVPIIKIFAHTVRSGCLSIDYELFNHEKTKMEYELDSIVTRISKYVDYKINISSLLDLEHLLFNTLNISYDSYSRSDLKKPFISKSLCKLENKYNVVQDILKCRDLKRDIRIIDNIIENDGPVSFQHADSTHIGITLNLKNFDDIISKDFVPFKSIDGYNIFKISIVDPELYTLFKWCMEDRFSKCYECGKSLNAILASMLNIDANIFPLFLDSVFSREENPVNIYRLKCLGYDYNLCLNRLLGIQSVHAFVERASKYQIKNKFLKSFNGSPVFIKQKIITRAERARRILHIAGRLTPLENLYKLVGSIDKKYINILYINYEQIILASKFCIQEIEELFSPAFLESTYPFVYNFEIKQIS